MFGKNKSPKCQHVWRVDHIEPSLMERYMAANVDIHVNARSTADARRLTSKTVTYTCQTCGTQKVEQV